MGRKDWNGRCQRCYKETNGHTMSVLNTQLICDGCDDKEKDHPRFEEAKKAELEQVKAGNFNYPGLLEGV